MTQNNTMISLICDENTSLSPSRLLLSSQLQSQHKQLLVPRDKLTNSKFYNNLISDCQCEVVYFPEPYMSCYDNYICYLTDQNIKSICIEDITLCHYLEDNVYLALIVNKLLHKYLPKNSEQLVFLIGNLNINSQRDVYLYFPYYWLPEIYICDAKFRQEWAKINSTKDFTANNTTYFHDTTYYLSGKVHEIRPYYYITKNNTKSKAKHWSHLYNVKRLTVLHGTIRSWSDNIDALLSRETYIHGRKHFIPVTKDELDTVIH